MITTVLITVVTLFAGLLAGYWFGKGKNNELKAERDEFQRQSLSAEARVELLQKEAQRAELLNQQLTEKREEIASLNTRLENAAKVFQQQKEEIQKMQDNNLSQFKVVAQQILEEKSKSFAVASEQSIKGLLNPLENQIKEFRSRVDAVYQAESNERHSLKDEIKRLVSESSKVSEQANNLTNALKTNVKLQGNWGEMLLESILEHSGLNKDREYFVQEFIRDKAGNVIKDEEGHGLQPDVTIYYPDHRKIICDSKVSLIAWDRYVSAGEEEERKAALIDHLKSLKAHIDGLSKKNYPKYAEALEYVLMFVPIEPAFLEAIKTDHTLWKYAYDRGIVMVSPTNLIAVLKIIADLWKVEQQSKNAIEIADRAGQLYDKFANFITSLEEVGQRIDQSQRAYEDAFKLLSTGKGNVLRQVEELKKMGARATKQLPDNLIKD